MPTIRRKRLTYRELMSHQTEALTHALKQSHAAFFMEMRTGKTLVCIRWIRSLGARFVLILAPITVLETWERELTAEGERFVTCYGLSARKRAERVEQVRNAKGRVFLLFNYESLASMGEVRLNRGKRKRIPPPLCYLPWDVVALDESTRIKNPNAQITNVCLQGFRQTAHRAILTGLPNPEGDLDLVCQFLFLFGSFLGCNSYWEFLLKYYRKYGFKWAPKRGTAEKIKREVHRLAFVKTAAQAGMPVNVVYETRHVNPTPQQARIYKQIEEEYAATLATGETIETKWVLAQRTWLQKVVGGFDPKNNLLSGAIADDIIELLNNDLARKKVVIWFKFRHELEYMQERLKKARISHVSILGGEPYANRKASLNSFRKNTRVLLAIEKVAKFGVDCSIADTCIYYSNEWGNEDRQQSEKRIVDIKLNRTHLVIDYAVRGTVSEIVIYEVRRKKSSSDKFMFMNRLEDQFRKHWGIPARKPRPRIRRKSHASPTKPTGKTSRRTQRVEA